MSLYFISNVYRKEHKFGRKKKKTWIIVPNFQKDTNMQFEAHSVLKEFKTASE